MGDGLYLIDTDYLRPGLAASHLLVDQGRAAFIDTGPGPAAPKLLAALDELGIAREQVDYLFLTHVHLDHANCPEVSMLHGLAKACSSEFADVQARMQRERMVTAEPAWELSRQLLETLLLDLVPAIKNVVSLRGIRVDDMEALESDASRISRFGSASRISCNASGSRPVSPATGGATTRQTSARTSIASWSSQVSNSA